MDSAMEERVRETVTSLLTNGDLNELTESKLRKEASAILDLDLSEPSRKKYVRELVESFLQKGNVVEEEEEEEPEPEAEEVEEEVKTDGKEYDDDGDLIICRLSERRRVTIQEFKGKTLVSLREYYDKDGKSLPTSKGISLTVDQWSSFKNNVSAIEKGIEKMKERLN